MMYLTRHITTRVQQVRIRRMQSSTADLAALCLARVWQSRASSAPVVALDRRKDADSDLRGQNMPKL